MARIEIDMEEYNNLHERIRNLEMENVEKTRKIEQQKSIINELKESIDEVFETSLFERLFKWQKLLSSIAYG